MNKQELIDFEDCIVKDFESGKIPHLIHFSGGNEDQLIDVFKDISGPDWVFSTHRSHYHYLLKGGNPEKLRSMIYSGNSMHVFDKDINFVSSAIVSGCPTIAAGLALSLKRNESFAKVWCFIGDGAESEGSFYEAVRYVHSNSLPCTFVIEDNNLSVDTPREDTMPIKDFSWPSCVKRYSYIRKWPHVQTGKIIKEYM